MLRRRLLRLLGASVCALATATCSKNETSAAGSQLGSQTAASAASGAAESAQAVAKKTPVVVTVGHDLWVGYSGVFLAEALGYFKEAGLEVKLKPFSNPGDTLPALISDQLDVGLTTLQNLAVLNGNTETDVVAIAVLDSSNGADAVVAKKSIATFADLKGKTVALTLGEVNHFLFLVGLKQNNMSPSAVKITSMSADDAGAAFVAGKVDAAVTWEPWVTKATKSGGHVLFTSASVPNTIMDSVAVRRRNLKGREEVHKSFLGAIDRGVQYLRKDPDAAVTMIGKYLSASADDVKGMLSGDKVYDLDDNKQLFGTSAAPGAVYASMKAVVEFALESKLMKTAKAAESLFEPSLVR